MLRQIVGFILLHLTIALMISIFTYDSYDVNQIKAFLIRFLVIIGILMIIDLFIGLSLLSIYLIAPDAFTV